MKTTLHLKNKKTITYGLTDFEHKFRGLLYSVLEDSEFSHLHNQPYNPFSFSNIYPPREEIAEDETVYITISSHKPDIIQLISRELYNKNITVGEYEFEVVNYEIEGDDITFSGELSTPTGVYCEVPSEYEQTTYWKKKHGINTFIEQIEQELDWLIDEIYSDKYSSENRNFAIFNGVQFERSFARPAKISSDATHTLILSKWTLSYTIQNELHNKYIQLAYQLGIGQKRSLGFGYLL